MRIIPIVLTLLLLVPITYQQAPTTLTINNVQGNNSGNGSPDNPYATFAAAFTNNISTAAVGSNFSVIFATSTTPYPVNFTLDGHSLGTLMLTSMVNNVPTNPGSSCSSLPTIILEGTGAQFIGSNVTLVIKDLTVQMGNGTNIGFNLAQGKNYIIDVFQSCLIPNINLKNGIMFNVRSIGTAAITFYETLITSNPGNISQVLSVLANNQVNVTLSFVVFNLSQNTNKLSSIFEAVGGPGVALNNSFTINQANITGSFYGTMLFDFFHVDNVLINTFNATNFQMNGETTSIKNCFFKFSAAYSVTIINVNIFNSKSHGLHLMYMDDIQLKNFTGISVSNVVFYQTVNISLIDSKLNTFQLNISNININQSRFDHNPWVFLGSTVRVPSGITISHLFNNIIVYACNLTNGFINLEHVDEKNADIEDFFPAYNLTVIGLNVQKNNITNEPFFNTGGVSLFVENPYFQNNSVYQTVLISAKQVLTNMNLIGGQFTGESYHKSSILQSPAMPEQDGTDRKSIKFLLYKLAAIVNCTFNSMIMQDSSQMIASSSPFVIFAGNTIFNLRLSGSTFMTNIGISSAFEAFIERNRTIEQILFGQFPGLLAIFENLFTSIPHCSNGCYYTAVVNNIFNDLSTGPSDPNNVFELNFEKDSITHYEFSQNNFTNVTISQNFVRSTKRNNAFDAKLNTFTNISSNNIFLIAASSNSFTFLNNTVTLSTFSKVFVIDIMHAGSNTSIQYNTISHCNLQGLFHVISPSSVNISIDGTTFYDSNVSIQAYSSISVIFLQFTSDTSSSHASITNFRMENTTMTNNVSIGGFYPALENTFFYVQTFAKSQLILTNITLYNVVALASYSAIADFQAGEIYATNFRTGRITVNESIGFGYSFQAATMVLTELEFDKNRVNVPDIFLGTHSLVYMGYSMGYNYNSYTIDLVAVSDWISTQPAFFIDVPTLNLNITQFYGTSMGPAFYVASQAAIINIFLTSYYTKDNQFFTMSNQVGSLFINVTAYQEYFIKDMPSILNSGEFSFVIPNKQLTAFFNNIQIQKVGFLQGLMSSGSVNILDLNVLRKDPTTFPPGLLYFTGGCQEVIVQNVLLKQVQTAYNQSFITIGSNTCESYVNISGITTLNTNFEALVNVQGEAGFIIVQDLVAVQSGYPIIQNAQNTNTNCSIVLYNIILNSHILNFLASQGATNVKIFNMIVVNSNIGQTSYVNVQSGGHISLFNSSFVNNVIENPSVALLQLQNGQQVINSVVYTNNTMQMEIDNAVVNVSNFTAFNNHGELKGAVFYFNGCSFSVMYSDFFNNTSTDAPVIYANITGPGQTYTITENNITGNINKHFGKAIGGPANTVEGNLTLINSQVKNITGLFGAYLAYNQTIVNSSFRYTQYNIYNVSAFLLNYSELVVALYDFKGQVISEGHDDFLVQVITNGQVEDLETDSRNGLLVINGSSININGNDPVNVLNFIITYHKEISYLDINLNLRACLPGEYVDSTTNLCVLCPAGLYSTDPKSQCSICPMGATCYGGNVVEVQPGFWLSPFTGFIIPCMSDGCTGGLDVDSQCAVGFDGGMCLGCDSSMHYSQDAAGQCSPCSNSTFGLFLLFFSKLAFSFAFEIAYIYLVYRANRKVNKMRQTDVLSGLKLRNAIDTNITGAQIKLFTNYTQFLFIIAFYLRNNLFLDTLEPIYYFLAVSRLTGAPSYVATNTIECLFLNWGVNPNNLPYDVMTFHLYFPVIKGVIYFGGVLYMNYLGKIKEKYLLINTAIVSYLLLEQLAPLQNMLQFSVCTFSGYVFGSYSIACNDPQYESYDTNVGIPVIIFWGLVVPIVLFLIVHRNKERFNDFAVRSIVGTMINHYKDNKYYWGFVSLLFKMLLILLFTIFKDAQTAMSLGFILIMFYYYLNLKNEPYINIELEKQENISIIAIAATMFLASIAIRTEYLIMEIIPLVLIILINAGVYIPSAWRIIASFLRVRRTKGLEAGLLDRISNDPNEQKMDTMKIT